MASNPSSAPRRRRWLSAGLTVLILAATLVGVSRWYGTEEDASGSAPAIPGLDAVALTVMPGINCLGGLEPAASYVVETPEGLVLIDSGLEANARSLKSEMAQLGLNWKHIRAILLT